MRLVSIRLVSAVAALAAATSVAALCGGMANAAPGQAGRDGRSLPVVASRSMRVPTGPVHVSAGDEILTGVSDTRGYHLYAASSGSAWSWQPLATLQPGGSSDERWIGRQCLTGDGREAVVVVAPWHASNSAVGMNAGGYGYLVDAHTGRVRPLASGLSLAYFDPGCGAGGQAMLTRYTRPDESATQLLTVNTVTGQVRAEPAMDGELTSPVPAAGGAVAVSGNSLVRITGITRRRLATFQGSPFDLRPTADGGVELLARQNAATVGWWRVSPAGASQQLGSGPLTGAGLFTGRAGRVLAVGLRRTVSGTATPDAIRSVPGGTEPPDGMSLDGVVGLRTAARAGRAALPAGRPGD